MNALQTSQRVTRTGLVIPTNTTYFKRPLTAAITAGVIISLEVIFKTIAFPENAGVTLEFPNALIWMLTILIGSVFLSTAAFVPRYAIESGHVIGVFAFATALSLIAHHNLTGELVLNPRFTYEQAFLAPLEHPLILIASYLYVAAISRIAKQRLRYDLFALPLAIVSLYYTTSYFEYITIPIAINIAWVVSHSDYSFEKENLKWREPAGVMVATQDIPRH